MVCELSFKVVFKIFPAFWLFCVHLLLPCATWNTDVIASALAAILGCEDEGHTLSVEQEMSWVLEELHWPKLFIQFWITCFWTMCEMEINFCFIWTTANLQLNLTLTETTFHWETMSSGFLPPLVKHADSPAWTAISYGHLCAVWPLWATFYYLKCGDNYTFPDLLTHGIEIINEIMCGEALGKLECALPILCKKLLSPAPYLFIKIEHTREEIKENIKGEGKGMSAFPTDHPWIIITRGNEELKAHCCNVSGWLSRIWQPLSVLSLKSRNLVSVSCDVSFVSTAWDPLPNGSGI